MKKVLVTGANGQLGLAIRAVDLDYPELSFTFTGKKELDVTDNIQVAAYFKANNFDVCINAAAYTNVDKAEDEKEAAYTLNETAPHYLAMACKQHNVFLLHISTDYVFDGTKGLPYTTADKPNPINVYGASKLAGEQALAAVGGDYCIVRTSWLYSEYGKNFQTKILEKAATTLSVEVVSDLYGTPTYAPNLVVFLLNIFKQRQFSQNIVHFSDGKIMNWYALAKRLTQIEIKEIASETINLKAKRPKNTAILNNLNE